MPKSQYLVIGWVSLALLFAPGLCEAKKKAKPVDSTAAADQAANQTNQTADQTQDQTAQVKSDYYAKSLGVGLVLGDPIGVNAKYWLDATQALSASLGSSLGPSGLGIYGDYQYHFYPFAEAPEVPIYVGGGAFVGNAHSSVWTGVRGVAGVSYIFKEPFDVFLELYPRFVFTPDPAFDVTLAIGGRVYFNLRQE